MRATRSALRACRNLGPHCSSPLPTVGLVGRAEASLSSQSPRMVTPRAWMRLGSHGTVDASSKASRSGERACPHLPPELPPRFSHGIRPTHILPRQRCSECWVFLEVLSPLELVHPWSSFTLGTWLSRAEGTPIVRPRPARCRAGEAHNLVPRRSRCSSYPRWQRAASCEACR